MRRGAPLTPQFGEALRSAELLLRRPRVPAPNVGHHPSAQPWNSGQDGLSMLLLTQENVPGHANNQHLRLLGSLQGVTWIHAGGCSQHAPKAKSSLVMESYDECWLSSGAGALARLQASSRHSPARFRDSAGALSALRSNAAARPAEPVTQHDASRVFQGAWHVDMVALGKA